MAARFLLDTNIVSDLVRSPQGTIAQTLERVGEQAVCTSIVAHALALVCTLVTANDREFRRVPGLEVENWLGKPALAEKLPNNR